MCKKLMFLVSIVVLLGLATVVSAQVELKVDVGCPGQEAAGNLKAGWVEFNGTACAGAVGPVAVTNIGGSSIDVAITVGNTSDNAYRSPSEYTGDEMGRDYVSADDGASQADCTMTMTLSNLPEAGYTLTSYHNCPDQPDPKDAIDITVSGSGVIGTPTNATNVAQTVLSSNVAFDDIGKGTVQFVADGAGEVVVTFVAREGVYKWRVYLNGFELSGADLRPTIRFESAASGNLESVSPGELTVTLSQPEEGQTYTVDYAATGGTATAGVDYVMGGAGPACWNSPTQCHGDTDNDGEVKGSDFLALKASWYKSDPDPDYNPCADFDRDGEVKGSDFLILKNNWYQTVEANCPPEGGSATLEFAPSETSKTISIEIINDGLDEEDETIIVELLNPAGPNVVLGEPNQHTYTILDPRPRVSFATATSSGSEGATVTNVEVRLSPASSETVTVDYAVTGGTATRDVDYILGDGTLTFSPGETTQNISITIIDDDLEEGSETIEITLSNPSSNALLGTRLQHTFTIDDNESVVVLEEFVGSHFSSFNHSSSIAETHKGVLVVTWYGGSSEGDDDVSIWVSTNDGSGWTPRIEVDDGSGDATWNPVLFQPSTGPLLLYYKFSGSPSSWVGAVRKSYDDGKTWSERILLPRSDDHYLSSYGGRFVGPVKNRPIELPDGSLLCGSSTEHEGWQVHMEIARGDYTNDFELIGPLGPIEGIQPTFLVHDDGYQTIQALCRAPGSGRPTPTTWSYDGGQTWTSLSTISLETSKGLHAVTINNLNQMKNRWHILAYNPSGRYPLRIAISQDGVNWDVAIDNVAPGDGSMDYPTIMQTSDKMLHLVFSWSNHSKIRHIVLNPYVLLGESP